MHNGNTLYEEIEFDYTNLLHVAMLCDKKNATLPDHHRKLLQKHPSQCLTLDQTEAVSLLSTLGKASEKLKLLLTGN